MGGAEDIVDGLDEVVVAAEALKVAVRLGAVHLAQNQALDVDREALVQPKVLPGERGKRRRSVESRRASRSVSASTPLSLSLPLALALALSLSLST